MEALYKHQIEFISYLQRLFQEGSFTATYKFAFLHAIADICIEKDVTFDNRLQITFDEIVDKLLVSYWQHAKPFLGTDTGALEGGVLLQNSKGQAKIVSDIVDLQGLGINSLIEAKSSSYWPHLRKSAMKSLKEGPLWRLQILSNQEECYFFPHIKKRNYIELNPGIAACFRQFHDLVLQFCRQGWVEKIAKIQQNQSVIGKAGELSEFLFSTTRSSLKPAATFLSEIQKGKCFYCHKSLDKSSEVDHFIPFTKYNNDLGHNFVIAHRACNNNKRDYLAAPIHRDNWLEQNLVIHKDDITEELSSHFICDMERSLHVANWAYGIAEKSGSKYWLKTKDVFV